MSKKSKARTSKTKQLSRLKQACFEVMGVSDHSAARTGKSAKNWKETRMARAWKEAAKDLGIEFEAPFVVKDRRGCKHVCSGIIPNFGSKLGVLVISGKQDANPEEIWDAASSVDKYRLSAMSPHYETYDRRLFIDALRNWGWYGAKGKRPKWYLNSQECEADKPCEACQHRDQTIDPKICSVKQPCAACSFYNDSGSLAKPRSKAKKK